MRLLRKLPLPPQPNILDVGCGDALFFPCLKTLGRPAAQVRGIEIDTGLLTDHPDRDRIFTKPLGDPLYTGPAGGWTFDLITALDVIEHIEDDTAALRDMLAMLRPGGTIVLTVPAFMTLWDHHDEINHHYRRYTTQSMRELVARVPEAKLVDVRYMFHALWLPKFAICKLNRRKSHKSDQFAIPPAAMNGVMTAACDLEARLISPFRIPFGTSVLAVIKHAEPLR